MTTPLKRTSLAALLSLAIGVPLAAGAADKPLTATGAQADHKTYSDRANMKSMTSERDALEKAMPVGQKADFYRSKLTSMGWKITATNDAEPDDIEYEAVKGRNSVEIQIDRDTLTPPHTWPRTTMSQPISGSRRRPNALSAKSDPGSTTRSSCCLTVVVALRSVASFSRQGNVARCRTQLLAHRQRTVSPHAQWPRRRWT